MNKRPGNCKGDGIITFSINDNDIYTINVDSPGFLQLNNKPGSDSGPAWSPTGDKIAFYAQNSTSNLSKQSNTDFHIECFPNPFTNSTTIMCQVKDHSKVTLKIYDILGNEIITLVDRKEKPGNKTIIWDGNDNGGNKTIQGILIMTLIIEDRILNKKINKIK